MAHRYFKYWKGLTIFEEPAMKQTNAFLFEFLSYAAPLMEQKLQNLIGLSVEIPEEQIKATITEALGSMSETQRDCLDSYFDDSELQELREFASAINRHCDELGVSNAATAFNELKQLRKSHNPFDGTEHGPSPKRQVMVPGQRLFWHNQIVTLGEQVEGAPTGTRYVKDWNGYTHRVPVSQLQPLPGGQL